MANEKVYTAKEAAFAVLAKAQELLGKSALTKAAEMDHEGRCEVHADKDAKGFAKSENCGVCKAEKPGENEIGTKFVKAENKDAPSNPMKPKVEEKQAPQRDAKNFETQPGKSNTPADARQAPQAAPSANPKEQAEGNNPPSGAVPGKGLHKLAFFMGHTHHKRKMKKGVALG